MARSRKKRLPAEPVKAIIESLRDDGRGLTHVDGKVVYVAGALPQEEVMFTYTRKRSKQDEGVATEILTPSPDRVEPPCKHFDICGGCSLQHLNPEAQIELKQRNLVKAFDNVNVKPDELFPLTTGTSWVTGARPDLG